MLWNKFDFEVVEDEFADFANVLRRPDCVNNEEIKLWSPDAKVMPNAVEVENRSCDELDNILDAILGTLLLKIADAIDCAGVTSGVGVGDVELSFCCGITEDKDDAVNAAVDAAANNNDRPSRWVCKRREIGNAWILKFSNPEQVGVANK